MTVSKKIEGKEKDREEKNDLLGKVRLYRTA